MERKQDRFRMEAAGSLTPALEGAPHSAEHLRNTKEKGRGSADEARQTTAQVPVLAEKEAR